MCVCLSCLVVGGQLIWRRGCLDDDDGDGDDTLRSEDGALGALVSPV